MSAPLGLADRIRDPSPRGSRRDYGSRDNDNGYGRGRSRSPGYNGRQYSPPRYGGDGDRSYDRGGRAARSRSPMYRRGDASSGGDFRKVYVGNLAYDTKWTHLKDYMRTVGEVLHADVLTGHDGRSKGCGVVEFASVADAQRAVEEFSEREFMGRKIFLREDREAARGGPPPRRDAGRYGERDRYERSDRDRGDRDRGDRGRGYDSYERPERRPLESVTVSGPQLFVMNLPYSVTWRELKDLFRTAGTIVRADVQQTPDGRSRGNGIVLYESVEDAQRAVDKFHGYEWQGRRVEIREDRYANESRDRAPRPERDQGRDQEYDSAPRTSDNPPLARSTFTDDASPGGQPNAIIYVANLPWATTNEDLVELFSTVGTVERAEIAYDSTSRPSGNAVVQLASTDLATTTIQKLDGYVYGQRALSITYAQYPGGAGAAGMTDAAAAPEPMENGSKIDDPILPPVPADNDDLDVPMPTV